MYSVVTYIFCSFIRAVFIMRIIFMFTGNLDMLENIQLDELDAYLNNDNKYVDISFIMQVCVYVANLTVLLLFLM